jgi:hypothetical protein
VFHNEDSYGLGFKKVVVSKEGLPWQDPSVGIVIDESLLSPKYLFYAIERDEQALFMDRNLTLPAPAGWYIENKKDKRCFFYVDGDGKIVEKSYKLDPMLRKHLVFQGKGPACNHRSEGTPITVWAKLIPPSKGDYVYLDPVGNARLDNGTYWCESYKPEGHVFMVSEAHSTDKQLGQVVRTIDCSSNSIID